MPDTGMARTPPPVIALYGGVAPAFATRSRMRLQRSNIASFPIGFSSERSKACARPRTGVRAGSGAQMIQVSSCVARVSKHNPLYRLGQLIRRSRCRPPPKDPDFRVSTLCKRVCQTDYLG